MNCTFGYFNYFTLDYIFFISDKCLSFSNFTKMKCSTECIYLAIMLENYPLTKTYVHFNTTVNVDAQLMTPIVLAMIVPK